MIHYLIFLIHIPRVVIYSKVVLKYTLIYFFDIGKYCFKTNNPIGFYPTALCNNNKQIDQERFHVLLPPHAVGKSWDQTINSTDIEYCVPVSTKYSNPVYNSVGLRYSRY